MNSEPTREAAAAERPEVLLKKVIEKHEKKYEPSAFIFMHEAVGYAAERSFGPGHLSGEQVAEGACDLAIERFGMLARMQMESWGLRSTLDIGQVVMGLCEAGFLTRREEDSLEDFEGLFTFDERFIEREWKKEQNPIAAPFPFGRIIEA